MDHDRIWIGDGSLKVITTGENYQGFDLFNYSLQSGSVCSRSVDCPYGTICDKSLTCTPTPFFLPISALKDSQLVYIGSYDYPIFLSIDPVYGPLFTTNISAAAPWRILAQPDGNSYTISVDNTNNHLAVSQQTSIIQLTPNTVDAWAVFTISKDDQSRWTFQTAADDSILRVDKNGAVFADGTAGLAGSTFSLYSYGFIAPTTAA